MVDSDLLWLCLIVFFAWILLFECLGWAGALYWFW